LLNCFIVARDFKVKGKILDRSTGKALCYAIVREINYACATTTNSEGFFEITLNPSNNILICSGIGYISDTVAVNTATITNTNIYLTQAPVFYKKISDSIKTFSAAELIGKVIASVKTMYSNMNNYEYISRNRYIIRENNGVGIGAGSVRVDDGIFKESINLISNIWKTKPMRINGIIEYSSKGYFHNPSSFREIIEGQKSHSSLPFSVNALLGTRRVQNLCSDELKYYDRPLPGPLSHDALNYYKYSFADTLMLDEHKIYKIYFEPIDRNDPGLTGYLYVFNSPNSILKIEASLNLGANVGNLFENVSIIQQFIPYKNGVFLPVDYRIFAKSNYMGIVKIEYELSSLLSNYKINSNAADNINVKSVQSVLPESGRTDSTYWANQENVPFTREEAIAFERIDSIRSFPKGYIYTVSRIISPQYQLSNHFSISGPLSIYQFNHVEGHSLSFSGSGNNLFDNTTDARITFSNGFSDKRFKESVSTAYYPDDDRSVKLSLNAYNKLATLFSSANMYSSFTSTLYSLFSNRDIRNFYYTNGFDFRVDGEVASFMRLYAAYSNHTDNSAKTNTTFSLLGNSHRNFTNSNSAFPDSINSPIYEARLNTLSFGINFDFRDNVEENYQRRKVSNGHTFVSFGAGILICSPKYLSSDIGYISYNGNILAEINTINTSSLSIDINGIYSNGPVPIQMQYALPGNISGTGRDLTFRTIGVGNVFGDQALTLNLEYNFRKEIYRLLPISFLQNLSLNTFFNAAWKNVSDKSAAIMPIAFSVLTKPLLETGFSFGYSSIPVSLELAWRLTHIDKGSFRIGFNTSIL